MLAVNYDSLKLFMYTATYINHDCKLMTNTNINVRFKAVTQKYKLSKTYLIQKE